MVRKCAIKVRIRGVDYADAHEAAAALGVKPHTIYAALSKGRQDMVGLGAGGARAGGGRPKVPIVVAGVRFESKSALARAIGRQKGNVITALKRGGVSAAGVVLAVMKLRAAEENKAMKETWRGPKTVRSSELETRDAPEYARHPARQGLDP